jgi:hypothetical protein
MVVVAVVAGTTLLVHGVVGVAADVVVAVAVAIE